MALRIYIFENRKKEPFAPISLRIRAVTRASVSNLFVLKWEGWSFYCLTGRASSRHLIISCFTMVVLCHLLIVVINISFLHFCELCKILCSLVKTRPNAQ